MITLIMTHTGNSFILYLFLFLFQSSLSDPTFCQNNECSTLENSANLCHDFGDLGYLCGCNGNGWIAPKGAQSCILVGNICETSIDPCKSINSSLNKCIWLGGDPILLGDIVQHYKYRCECRARGWITPKGAQSCLPPRNICEELDPCNQQKNSQNVCVNAGDGTYFCSCQALLWKNNLNNQKCVCVNPCSFGNKCNTFLEPGNICVDEYEVNQKPCGTYSCNCNQLRGWLSIPNAQYCQPPDPCTLGDPCSSGVNAANICISDGSPSYWENRNPISNNPIGGLELSDIDTMLRDYKCQCNGNGWFASAQNKTCLQCPTPCDDILDPCRTRMDHKNTCHLNPVEANVCPSFTCRCDGDNYILSTDMNACQSCQRPCSDDPCQTEQDSRNVCMVLDTTMQAIIMPEMIHLSSSDDMCGMYICSCGGAHWLTSPDTQSCLPCPDPCTFGDPCLVRLNPENVCISLTACGQYTCKCGSRYLLVSDGHRCQPCANPCSSNADPCNTLADFSNICKPLRGTCDYICQCSGVGWVSSLDKKKCEFCVDPCLNDPCSKSIDPNNFCIQVSRHFRILVNTVNTTNAGCAYICKCSDDGWITPIDAQSCEQCPHPCGIRSDPCLSHLHSSNVCQSVPKNNGCSTYECICNTPGWYAPTLRQSCEPCPDPCIQAEDPCQSASDSRNICRQNPSPVSRGACPGYICKCEGNGWNNSLTQLQRCVVCNDPCSSDPCFTRLDNRNTCISNVILPVPKTRNADSSCPGYTCQCLGENWFASPGLQNCQKCRDPCQLSIDPCAHTANHHNVCIPNTIHNIKTIVSDDWYNKKCTGYTCHCLGYGWIASSDAKFCQPCPNPCDNDKCSSSIDNQNICIYLFDPLLSLMEGICPGYRCECRGNMFLKTLDSKSCAMCPTSCDPFKDPCATRQDSRNQCISVGQSTASCTFFCDCRGTEWHQGLDGLSCQYCENPCKQADPCNIRMNPQNVCIFQEDDCGHYTCRCHWPDFIATVDAQHCKPCDNPCTSPLDPCSTQLNSLNLCIPSKRKVEDNDDEYFLGPVSRRISQRSMTISLPKSNYCYDYTCICGGKSFMMNSDSKACLQCSDPCTFDPCMTQEAPNNICIPLQLTNDCAEYICDCGEEDYYPTEGSQSCIKCHNACLVGDPCMHNFSPFNLCVPLYPPKKKRRSLRSVPSSKKFPFLYSNSVDRLIFSYDHTTSTRSSRSHLIRSDSKCGRHKCRCLDPAWKEADQDQTCHWVGLEEYTRFLTDP